MSNRKDSPTSTDKSLEELLQDLLDRGVVSQEQVKAYEFHELYNADPDTLSVPARRMQLLMHNSQDFAEVRKKQGFE